MPSRPRHIVVILADDLGYGDMGWNNPDSRIPTPHLDRLAAEGMHFTDAHAGSSLCTPSRYNLLTGRYAWRSRLKKDIVWEWDGPLIEPDRPTLATLLRGQGYRTACIGKWHLGWDWPTHDGTHPNDELPFGVPVRDVRQQFGLNRIDLTSPLGGGPLACGFETYFGVDVPNFPPYGWIEDDHLVGAFTVLKPDSMYGRAGWMTPGWTLEGMIPELTRRAVTFLTDSAEPGFLYFPLTSPHSPIVPNAPFLGRSGAGRYGDFVCEVDWVVGRIVDALERAGVRDDTLLLFTSDNGPEVRTPDDQGAYDRARQYAHFSMGPLRGVKCDAWEGGHRVPMLASWPGVIAAGSRCDRLVGLGDLMATCAEAVGAEMPPGAAEDSESMLPLLRGAARGARDFAIHHSAQGKFVVRRGDWVLIDAPTGDERGETDWFKAHRGYLPHDLPGELYNLRDDLAERRNLHAERPDIVAELAAILQREKR
ncbi:MAG: arylsulfatase [Phycisphaeraceae bacterium]|nr:arylsulfatase [Phycisphaeraceae bacterium]